VGARQDDLFNAVFWVRHALSVLLGVVWGVVPLTGLLAFAAYVPWDVL
jgi:hypothetical protein